nr:mandelate racemase/muconate lactonizing enzyme family protein [Mesorhizobium sp. WSM4875]
MKIASIEVIPYRPLFIEPFKQFGVTQTQLQHDIIRLQDTDGRVGYGEAVLSPVLSRDAAKDKPVVDALIGTTLSSLPGTVAELRREGTHRYAVSFGLDTAYHDLISRSASAPLYGVLGGRRTQFARDFLTVPLCDVDDTIRRLKEDVPRHAVVQMKLGEHGIDVDMARIQAALTVMNADQTLLADFNGALNPVDARTVIASFSDKRIVWEEPCKLFDENEQLAEQTGAPVLADQCINVSKIPRVCERGVFYGITIKPAKTGSLTAARTARDMCAEVGIRVRIDGPWCGPVATAAILHVAVGAPEELLIASTDMTVLLALKEDEKGGLKFDGKGNLSPLDEPGIGFVPTFS